MTKKILTSLFLSVFILSVFPQIIFSQEDNHPPIPWDLNDVTYLKAMVKQLTGQEASDDQIHLAGGTGALVCDFTDPKVRIAKNMLAVRKYQMTPQQFYADIARMDLGGTEVRHLLMGIKKDIGDYKGVLNTKINHGLEYFLGQQTKNGGSLVEVRLLSWRRKVVYEGIEKVLADFANKTTVDGVKYSVYLAEIGSWPKEALNQMKFAGDIDFSFMCGNIEIARQMRDAFNKYIMDRVGITPESFDSPCTAHGMATDEVYLGKHGQSFAEKVTKTVKEIIFGETEGSRIGQKVEFKKALTKMLLESKYASLGLEDLKNTKWPTEPGISLEMIRHFEHDIMDKNVYNDFESFIKAAKYLERSNAALVAAGGEIKNPRLKHLAAFAELLVENKNATGAALGDLIETFYKNHFGTDLPYDVKLGTMDMGKAKVTLEANEKFIREFWDACKQVMWDNVMDGFQRKITEYNSRLSKLPEKGKGYVDNMELKRLHQELTQMREMIEVQSRVMHDAEVGVHKVPTQFDILVDRFRSTIDEFHSKSSIEIVDPKLGDTFRYIDTMLKLKKPQTIRMALHAMLSAPEKMNYYMDYLDNNTLGYLRGETNVDWMTYLKHGEDALWIDKMYVFLGKPQGKAWEKFASNNWKTVESLGKWSNKWIWNNFAARGIRTANQAFARGVQESTVGTVTMKGLIAFNLYNETTTYVDILREYQDDPMEGLGQVATEFARRRVPGALIYEHYMTGDYLLCVWDAATLLYPPKALAELAFSMGSELARQTWNISYSEELKKFTEELYEYADFTLLGYEKVGDDIKLTNWRLNSVVYNGKKVDVLEFFDEKERQIKEMEKYVRCQMVRLQAAQTGQKYQGFDFCKELKSKDEIFPTEYLTDGITGWLGADVVLRENLAAKDPWLMLMKEMMKNEHVGQKLKEDYQELWYTRWEKVKLDYMKYLKKRLEEMRATEQSIISGDYLKMYDELMKVIEELRIKDEVLSAMEGELGGEAYKQLMRAFDFLKGTYREYASESDPDVWTHFEERARVIEQNLKAYSHIQKNRDIAEKYFGSKSKHGQFGLRLMTGTRFFEGKYKTDKDRAFNLHRIPAEAQIEMEQALKDIKSQCNPEEEFCSEGECHDQTFLQDLTYYESFRMMWQWINDHSEGGTQEEMDQILRPLHFYRGKVKSLLDEYKKKHCTQENSKMGRLEKKVREAEQLAAECGAACNEAKTFVNGANSKLQGVKTELKRLEKEVSEFEQIQLQMPTILSEIGLIHEDVENKTTEIGENASDLQSLSSGICAGAEKMQDVDTNTQRDNHYRDINAKRREFSSILNNLKMRFNGVKNLTKEGLGKNRELKETKKKIDGIVGLAGAIKGAKDCADQIDKASDKLGAAEQKIGEIEVLYKEAKVLAKEVKRSLKTVRKTDEGKAQLEKVDRLLDRVKTALNNVKGCPGTVRSDFDRVDKDVETVQKDLDEVNDKIQKLYDTFGKPGVDSSTLTGVNEKADLIDYLFKMAVRYAERAGLALKDAEYCLGMADNLAQKKISVYLPNYRNSDINKALGNCRGLGLSCSPAEIQQATTPQEEYKVISQTPAGDKEVKISETSVTLNHFGELNVEAYLQKMNCDDYKPGSYAVYIRDTKKVLCVCNEGLVESADQSQCIDCNQYVAGFQRALQAQDINGAKAIVMEAQNCQPWSSQAMGQINMIENQLKCQQLEAQIMGVANRVPQINVQQMFALMDQAQAMGCQLSGACFSAANAAISRQDQYDQANQYQPPPYQPPVDPGPDPMDAMIDFMEGMNEIINQGNDWNNGGGGGNLPPPQVLNQRTITGNWSVSGRHKAGHTSTGRVTFNPGGKCSYEFHDRFKDGRKLDYTGSGTWTLEGDYLNISFDRGGKFEGHAEGHSNAFTLSVSNNGWNMSFRRR